MSGSCFSLKCCQEDNQHVCCGPWSPSLSSTLKGQQWTGRRTPLHHTTTLRTAVRPRSYTSCITSLTLSCRVVVVVLVMLVVGMVMVEMVVDN